LDGVVPESAARPTAADDFLRYVRILHLATTYPLHEADSNAGFVEALAEAVCRRGHQVDVLLPYHPDLRIERPGKQVNLHTFLATPLKGWHPWGYAQALTADRSLRWDAYLATPFAVASATLAMRRILRAHRIDIAHADWLLPSAPIVAGALRGRSEAMVVSCHGSGVFLAERRGWAAYAARWGLRRAAAVTACSQDLTARVGVLGAGPDPVWIPYGVDVDLFAPLDPAARGAARRAQGERHGVVVDDPWIVAVGRLVHKKGFAGLVTAMATIRKRVPGARLLIAGEGPLRNELLRQAAVAGVAEAVHLIGPLPGESLAELYAVADLIAVPSVHGPGGNVDGLPNVFLEGLASGTPVVATRVGGIPDIGRDGDTVALVPEADVDMLAHTIADLLRDEGRRRAIGAAARRDAVERLGWDRVAARLEDLYQAVVKV